MSESLLRAEGLEKRFGSFVAVDGVDLRLEHGELRGLIGPNGAGKTTLFDLLSGLLEPTAGRVHFRGEEITGLPAHAIARRGMARALQIAGAFPSLSVTENVVGAINGRKGRLDPLAPSAADAATRERAAAILERVGLVDVAGERVADLSHADAKLLEVALALALDPELLLLDEPTAGLSSGETAAMTELVAELGEDVTVVLVEHDVDVVMAVAERLTVLHQGSVIADGTPGEVREDERVRDVYFGRET